MIIVLTPEATEKDVKNVVKRIEELGLEAAVSHGKHRTVIGVIGEEDKIRIKPLEAIPFVEKVVPILRPYKLASREFRHEDTVVDVKGVPVGGGSLTVIAGPCAVENEEMLHQIAKSIKAAGAKMLRGGAFKPRTSPYSFQGLGEEGLKFLRACSDELGLPVVTEVLDTRDVSLVEKYADVLQVGARNMQNFALLSEVGMTRKPVMLKRGMAATITDWLMSAEYILAKGNSQVILCERGIRTFEDSTRNTLDISAIPNIKMLSHLPIIADPSHSTGRWGLVPPMARAAIAAGADGIMVEVHCQPTEALCDGNQSLLPEKFDAMMRDITNIAKVLNRQNV